MLKSVRSVTELCFVVHDQFPLDKIKTVRLCFPWTCDHLVYFLIAEFRQLVNCLHWVHCVRHAKWHLELVWFYQLVLEVMSLNHHELFYRLRAHSEIQCSSDRIEVKEHRPEMVLDCASVFFYRLSPVFFLLFDFEESLSCWISLVNVPNFKIYKFDLVCVGLGSAKIPFSRSLQISRFLNSNVWIHVLNDYSNERFDKSGIWICII